MYPRWPPWCLANVVGIPSMRNLHIVEEYLDLLNTKEADFCMIPVLQDPVTLLAYLPVEQLLRCVVCRYKTCTFPCRQSDPVTAIRTLGHSPAWAGSCNARSVTNRTRLCNCVIQMFLCRLMLSSHHAAASHPLHQWQR